MTILLHRRRILSGLALGGFAAGTGSLMLVGCDRISNAPLTKAVLNLAEPGVYRSQRDVFVRQDLAPEFRPDQMSPVFRTNGNTMPGSTAYQALMANGFRDWQLSVDGLVAEPLKISLADLRAMPTRTQITRHDCVEGWSAIGQWTGVPLRLLLEQARLLPAARYIVFRCADDFDGTPYYESVDIASAIHPQTILAWEMNGKPLTVGHGAPLRPAGRAAARLQAGQIRDGRGSGVEPQGNWRRQGRLLGRQRGLPVVRGHLNAIDPGEHARITSAGSTFPLGLQRRGPDGRHESRCIRVLHDDLPRSLAPKVSHPLPA